MIERERERTINERERKKEKEQMRKSSRGKQIERYIDRKSQREEKGGDVKA